MLAAPTAAGDVTFDDVRGGCYVELCSQDSQDAYITHRLMREQLEEIRAIRRERRERNDGEYEYETQGSNSCADAGERPCDDLNHPPREGD